MQTALRRKILEQARQVLPAGHAIIVKFARDLGESLAAQKRDEEAIAFYGSGCRNGTGCSAPPRAARSMRKWLAEAEQRRGLSAK